MGEGKHWWIWRLPINLPKFSHPKIVNTLKYNGKLTRFAKFLPPNMRVEWFCQSFTPPKFYTIRYLAFWYCPTITNDCPLICQCQVFYSGRVISLKFHPQCFALYSTLQSTWCLYSVIYIQYVILEWWYSGTIYKQNCI